ncbi:MAG: hypothetical protein II239_07690, partial [Peptococcaceae bacterium]|nr:hypothetical protein [Peptococcaceae bacterium]
MKRKLIAYMLIVCMLFTFVPVSAFAAESSAALNITRGPMWTDTAKGEISWPEKNGYTFYDVVVKRIEGKDEVLAGTKQYRGQATNGVYTISVAELITASGDYTFYVAPLEDNQKPGSGGNYAKSQNILHYTMPSVSVATPQALQWRGNTASWEITDSSNIQKYLVHYFKKGATDSQFSSFMSMESKQLPREDGYIYEAQGNFWQRVKVPSNESYIFSVQAISSDLTKAANSERIFLNQDKAITASSFQGQLGTPTGVEWCKENGKITGDIAFYPVANQSDMYNVVLYNDDQVVSYKFHSYFYDWNTGKNIIELSNWILDEGNYKVLVRAIGDGVRTFDGDFASCKEVFTYKLPDKQLSAPNNVYWTDHLATWNGVEGAESYKVDYYLNDRWKCSIHNAKTSTGDGHYVENSGTIVRRMINYNGEGKYKFQVRAISGEIHEVAHSKASGYSGTMNLQAISKDVNAKLDELITKLNSGTIAEIDKKDSMKFAVAMATNPETRDKM